MIYLPAVVDIITFLKLNLKSDKTIVFQYDRGLVQKYRKSVFYLKSKYISILVSLNPTHNLSIYLSLSLYLFFSNLFFVDLHLLLKAK